MRQSNLTITAAVFFCSWGWICAGQAHGAEDQAQGTGGARVVTADAVDRGLFEPVEDADGSEVGDLGATSVKVSSFGTIDLHVKDLELAKVLQLLSIQSQRNIVASRNVAGVVTADLYGVDFYEALDAILHTNGFGYREKGQFIYVYTLDEIEQIEDTEREVTHRVVHLNYLTATDASTFVAPLLSAAGSIAISGDATQGFAPSTGEAGADTFAGPGTLIVRDYPENVDEIVNILGELDVRPAQVLVEASVLQARLTEKNAFGVDLSILADFAIDEFADPFRVVDDIFDTPANPNGAALQTSPGRTNTLTDTSVKVGIVTNSVAAFINALDSVTDTTILANPKIMVLNRQKADLLVGQRLGYISTTQSDTSTTQSVEFLDVGTQLTLRPFVSRDGMIRMELRPSISDGETRLVGDFVIPDQTTQEVTTNVMLQSGQTLVLGGLFKEDTTVSRRQVPWLGDIPIVGAAFKGQDDLITRSEVIFLITATIQKDEAMYAVGESLKDSIEMASHGARQGLLPWSRTKLVATHMRDAMRYYERGDEDKALWAVNMALSLDPTVQEGQKLKEKLTGERVYWPHGSILKDALDGVVEEHLKAQGETEAQPGSSAPTTQPSEAQADAQDPRVEAVVPVADSGDWEPELEAVEDSSFETAQDAEPQATDSQEPVEDATAEPRTDSSETSQDDATADVLRAMDEFLTEESEQTLDPAIPFAPEQEAVEPDQVDAPGARGPGTPVDVRVEDFGPEGQMEVEHLTGELAGERDTLITEWQKQAELERLRREVGTTETGDQPAMIWDAESQTWTELVTTEQTPGETSEDGAVEEDGSEVASADEASDEAGDGGAVEQDGSEVASADESSDEAGDDGETEDDSTTVMAGADEE